MIAFNHFLSGLYWGFGTISRLSRGRTATGPFCYLTRDDAGQIERWEGSYTDLPQLLFDERIQAVRIDAKSELAEISK